MNLISNCSLLICKLLYDLVNLMNSMRLSIFTLFLSILLPCLPPHPATARESAADPSAFTLQIAEQAVLPIPDHVGAFRIFANGKWYSGGGADFPPTRGHLAEAIALDTGAVVERTDDQWKARTVSLPEPVAWPAVVADGDSLIVIGGIRKSGFSNQVSRWTWNGSGWKTQSLAPLPGPLALAGARILDGTLVVAGGTGPNRPNRDLLELRLGDTDAAWKSRPILNASTSLMEPLMIVRKDEVAIRNALFIGGGWRFTEAEGNAWEPGTAFYKYLPSSGSDTDFVRVSDSPETMLLHTASALGPSHILVSAVPAQRLAEAPAFVPGTHFPAGEFKRYHVFTDTWTAFTSGLGQPVTYLDWTNRKELVLAVTRPEGSEAILTGEIEAVERHFQIWDYLVMAAYMMGLVAIGKYFASRERSTEDFFLGGRRVPWWAAGLSIYATGTSAISFMAIPAKTYATDWLYFIGMSIFPFFTVTIAAFVFIPLLRRLEITTVMEYFEMRFGRPVRLLMSAVAVLGQVAGRMSITLLLPSIALTAVTGMNLYVCILVMGVLATIYTAVGGISAVIWTDVLQVFVLFGGALLSFALIVMKVDGGLASMVTLAVDDNKFNLLDASWDFTTATIWIMVLWAVSDVFGKGLGQEGLQRAFSTKGVKEARRSMITCAVVALPAGLLFYGIGTALYAFYHTHPELLNPTLQTDAIFPLFIAQQLPVGIAGLVISGLFAASMSTLDTAMNTSSTIIVRDFYSIWRKDRNDHEKLVLAKVITVVCGALGTGIALYMASFENLGSLWDMFSILLGVIGGGLGGVGVLALCTTRANTWGTLAGAVVTAISIVLIKEYTTVHFFIYGTISMAIGSTTGYCFSLVLPKEDKDLTGLTLWTPAPKNPE